MDFLGIGNNRFIKHKEHSMIDEDIAFRDEIVLTLDTVSQINVPISQTFKFKSTLKTFQRQYKQKHYD